MSKKDDDKTRLAIHRIHANTDMITKISSELFKWGCLAFIIFCASDVLIAYAGKITLADVSFSFMSSDNLQSSLAVVFGFGGIIYGKWQSKLRRDVIEKMQPERIRMELEVNPNRTSSGLTKRGDTRGGD